MLGLVEPHGPGVRVDSGLARGTVVGSDYDPMLAKVIAHGGDRAAALRALDRALAETAVLGVATNIEFLRFLLADPDVAAGRLDTGLLDRPTPDFAAGAARGRRARSPPPPYRWLQRLAGAPAARGRCRRVGGSGTARRRRIRLRAGERTDHVRI